MTGGIPASIAFDLSRVMGLDGEYIKVVGLVMTGVRVIPGEIGGKGSGSGRGKGYGTGWRVSFFFFASQKKTERLE